MDEAVAAIINIEDYKAITKALATAKEAFIKDLQKVDFKIKPNINKRSTIFIIRQDTS